MKLYIVRHGESIDNMNKVTTTKTTFLSEKGREQAKNTAKELRDIDFDIAIVSPYRRAQQTAKYILKYHKNTQKIDDERITERSFGKREGISKEELAKIYPDKTTSDSDMSSIYELDPDIEHNDSLMNRAKDFLGYLKSTYNNKTILIVAHRQINSALIYTITNKPYGEYLNIENGEVQIFEY